MNTIVFQEQVRIPDSVVDLDSFRVWAKSDAFPDCGRYSYFNGELWVDLMPEQLFTHNDVKMECAEVIRQLFKKTRRGRFFGDGTLVTNVDAGLSTEPNGTVVLFESLELERVRLIESSSEEGYIEIEGTPDVVLEIVSKSSVQKDTVVLRELYWNAGIPEYWLVDVRGDRLVFDILKRGRKGYVVTRKPSGWVKSAALGKSFQLTRTLDAAGNPEYTLTVR
jgi:Uma2 family endonuclease